MMKYLAVLILTLWFWLLWVIYLLINHNLNSYSKRNVPHRRFITKPEEDSLEQTARISRNDWDQLFEDQIAEDERRQLPGLGDNGRATLVADEEGELVNEIIASEAFNLLLSNRIMYNRTLLDPRHPKCSQKKYPEDLPSASVVIVFHNERWSTLIRTVHSVLNGSPARFLKEIVLVDDFSSRNELHGKLDYYVKTRFRTGVKLIRMKTRSGLIRARLHGARLSSGDVLLFLDAHCEVTKDWLRPLLARIKEERRAVVVPVIDAIDYSTFEYRYDGDSFHFGLGGFSWDGRFTWIEPSTVEEIGRTSSSEPVKSPTMAGGLFAINREYFWEIGSYDQSMNIWGGENLEMSFRVWQCGGLLEIIPCSRVGHVFRRFAPYILPWEKDYHGINTARVARVWMDDYQRLFFLYRPELKRAIIGDISERVNLRKKLNCKSFKWYLTNIYTSKFIPDENVRAWGRTRNDANNCLGTLQTSENAHETLGIYPCRAKLVLRQYFSLSMRNELRNEFNCAQVFKNSVYMYSCSQSPSQQWIWMANGLIMHRPTRLCLEGKIGADNHAKVVPCDKDSSYQIWSWEKP